MGSDSGRDRFNLGVRNLQLEFIVILHADLLHAGEGTPPLLDDIVEVAPVAAVVELARGGGTDSPDLVEEAQDVQDRVGLDVGDGLDVAVRVLPFLEELGCLLIATGEGENLAGAGKGVGVCGEGGNDGTVGANADVIAGKGAG